MVHFELKDGRWIISDWVVPRLAHPLAGGDSVYKAMRDSVDRAMSGRHPPAGAKTPARAPAKNPAPRPGVTKRGGP